MSAYIDGFAFPIAQHQLADYQVLASAVADIWLEHGALDYREFIGDDMHLEGTRSFIETVAANSNEAVVFGWVTFESRQARDIANEKVSADPRMAELIEDANVDFDPTRMAYGGFAPLVPGD